MSQLDGLLQPLSARSILASTLLGTYPPRLPGSHLVAFAREFDVAEGTTRVALTRMVERGELINDNGWYELAGSLRSRQDRQTSQRHHHRRDAWDGRWEQVLVISTGRKAAERNALRRTLTAANLGEVREGVWMRPANLARQLELPPGFHGQTTMLRVDPMDPADANAFVGVAFDLEAWNETAKQLCAVLADQDHQPETDLAASFSAAAAALRHLTHDPLLPSELEPADWASVRLREDYDRFEKALQIRLRAFFAALRST